MYKLKPFDPDAFLEEYRTKDNPYATQPIGVLLRIFLDSQSAIGIRQFSTMCGVSRHRLKNIINEESPVDPTDNEIDAISEAFAKIVSREEAKKKTTIPKK